MSRYLPARLLAAGDPMDSLAKAPSVHIPTLLIHGSEDTAVPASMSATLAGRLPHAYRVVLPGRGHNDVDDAVVRAAVVAATEPPERWVAAMRDPSASPG
jgi:pimeloyl-ACP methyl ester carboxylesterase